MQTSGSENMFTLEKRDANLLKIIIDTWWQLQRLNRKRKIVRFITSPFIHYRWMFLGWFMLKFRGDVEAPVEYYLANYKDIKNVRKEKNDDSKLVSIIFERGRLD